jgi:uncharacterized protein (DUF427 family)
MSRTMLLPSDQHPITIEPATSRVVVRVDGHQVADSRSALTLRESTYPAVQYIPIGDVDQTMLRRTETSTYCPFKGDCAYYSVVTGDGTTAEDVVWTYENPYPAVAAIAGHVAFYVGRSGVTLSETDD